MSLYLILALMTAVAVFAVLWPLSRETRTAGADTQDVEVYRDQLDEIERDRKAGMIGDREAEAARMEISRRLLAAAEVVRESRGKLQIQHLRRFGAGVPPL